MDEYKIYTHNNPVKPKKGRPNKYWDRMMDCKNVNDSFFVKRTLGTMTTNVWRMNKRLIQMNSDWRFRAFQDSEFKCSECGTQQLLSQVTHGGHCIECNKPTLQLLRKGCSVQRIS